MEGYKLNKTDIDFLREYLEEDSPHSNHIARVELRDYFNDLLKKESFEVGKYYYYRDVSKLVFKVTDCVPFDTIFGGSVYGYGIDLDEDDFEENGCWVDLEDIEYSKEISEEEFLQYIIDHLDIHEGDGFIGVSGNLHKASREPYIRDGGVYVKNEKMLTVCLFKDGNIGRKTTKEKVGNFVWKNTIEKAGDSVWKKTMDLRWNETSLQQKHIEVNTGEEMWKDV